MHTYYGISIYNVSLRDSVADAFASHTKEIFSDSADVESIFFNSIPDMLKQALYIGPLYTTPGCFLPRVESPQRVLKINTLHEPGLWVCDSVWFASSLTRVSLPTDQKVKTWLEKDDKQKT